MEAKEWLTTADSSVAVQRRDGGSLRGAGSAGRSSAGVLSKRELEVLDLIALGKTDRQIAEDLFISRITVSNHVVHILDKLNVPNRTAAAIVAAANSLISLGGQRDPIGGRELSR
jgi:DNA-binding NarL/FixJ family response regulator